ncbi:MAG: 1-deoxy-D-xylulose-5-phosphate reductoisomerase [Gammaproteobacteria bacterium]|nr:1-deoxy-D-xylulose-5-phosphate reductoisomerase [Gammaproteobacteria bacterium]
MIGITILGSTGSIGVSTLDVISQHSETYSVVALTANHNVDRMYEQCLAFAPEYAVMVDADAADKLATKLTGSGYSDITVLSGIEGLEKVASLDKVEQVMAAIVGAAGLRPSLAAARSGKRVLLANKEALVLSGQIFIDEVKNHGAELLPIDSEHNAIFQCMPANYNGGLTKNGITKILLTASGGPFRTKSLNELHNVTPAQACAHPNWEMGRKISVDSATMMNKGLEVIEARWLFDASADDIQVVVHPQSVIHSMVQYNDGSVLAQLGNPDMRTPIAHAMSWPKRMASGVASLNLFEIARLDFEQPDFERFPCLRLSYEALRAGGTSTAILNAANEIAVEAFLNEKIAYTAIPEVIESTLSLVSSNEASDLECILADDAKARQVAEERVAKLSVH